MAPLAEALHVVESLLGDDHYEVSLLLGTLAGVEERAGEPARAVAHYERSVAIQRRILGASHPDVRTALHSLSLLRRRLR